MFRKLLNKLTDSLIAWISGLLVPALAAIFLLNETSMRDLCFKVRYLFQSRQAASSPLVVLAVTTKKASEPAKVTPRAFLAHVINSVAHYEPRVMALDYEFLEADRSDPHYAGFRQALADAGNIVLPCFLDLHAETYRLLSSPPADLVPFRQTGYATLESAYDMKLQTQLEDQSLLPSFALATVAAYSFPEKYFNDEDSVFQALPLSEELQTQTLAHIQYPLANAALPINYAGPIKDRPYLLIPVESFLQAAPADANWKRIINDKLVVIGSTCRQSDSSDQFATPYGTMFGVEVHANIINNLLTRNYLKPLGRRWEIFFTLLSLAVAALSLWRLRLKLAGGVTVGWLLVYATVGFALFANRNLILPLAWPLKAGFVGFLLIYALQRYGPLKRVREFLDFEILLEATERKNRYRLRLIAAPGQAGDASQEIILTEKDELEKGLKRLQMGRADQTFLQSFGHRLYQYLFPKNIEASYQRGLTQARMEKKGLRVRLRIEAPELRVLPWEYLYDQRNHFFFAANPEILLTRYVESNQPKRDLRVEALNVLVVLANPKPETLFALALSELDALYEKDLIVAALHELRDNADIPIRYTILEHAVIDDMRKHLREEFHVLHFVGHSTFREGVGKIVLENDEHEAIFVDEAEFGNLFLGCNDMRLVILNSCQSATTAALPTISGLAYQIIQRGVPAVVAMQYPIADETATLFAREFYRMLAGGNSVDFAMAHARLAIAQKMKNTRRHDFGVPVLFMRAREGMIV